MNRSSEPVTGDRWAAPSRLTFARFYFLLAALLAAYGLPGIFAAGQGSGHALGVYSLRWVGLLSGVCVLGVVLLAIFILLLTPRAERLMALAGKVLAFLTRLGRWNLLLALLTWSVYILAIFWRLSSQFGAYPPRLWFFWLAAGLAALFLCAVWPRLGFFWGLLASAVALGFIVRVLGYLPDISATPFTMAWSEASRFFYASLPFSRQIYGQAIPLSSMHPSRYLILGLPFVVPGISLEFLRFWQVFLWIVLSLLTGLALMRRFGLSWLVGLAGAGWAALFLQQGPVYYHLLVCVILVLWGFDARRLARSTIIVLLASLWAGISRVNWYPVPAMLAIAFYLLETPLGMPAGRPLGDFRKLLRYFLPPAIWGIAGLAAAAAANAIYIRLSGQPDPSVFDSTYSSALLWYRLLPNSTSPMGVLPAILLITLPALLLALVTGLKGFKTWHVLRLLGLAAMLAVLFGGGLVVSTKIGGGSNIHNLDAYIVLTLILVSALWMGVYTPETRGAPRPWRPWLLTFLIVAVPLAWNLNIANPFPVHNPAQDAQDLATLNTFLKAKTAGGGEVLFITQRQLVTFGDVPGLRTVPDYEVLMLSEMALARNMNYLNRFDSDLSSHRFAAIVVDPQRDILQDPATYAFAEENNAWVTYISRPILASYQTALRIDRKDGQFIDVMLPRP